MFLENGMRLRRLTECWAFNTPISSRKHLRECFLFVRCTQNIVNSRVIQNDNKLSRKCFHRALRNMNKIKTVYWNGWLPPNLCAIFQLTTVFLNTEKRYIPCQYYIRERALTRDSYLFASKKNPHRNAISVNWKSKVGTDTFRWNKWQKRNAKLNILLSRRCIWCVC